MPEISVVIVSWNARAHLFECLKTLRSALENVSAEVIVVDNASDDGSQDMVRESYPEVRLLVNADNLGFSRANNIGIRESRGEYLGLVNSDVEVLVGCVDSLLGYMKTHPDVGMLGPQILDSQGRAQRSCMGRPTIWNLTCRAMALDSVFRRRKIFSSYLMGYQDTGVEQSVDIINGCFWMIRRAALRQVGLLDERFFIYAEDKDWCKRFWEAGWKVVYYPMAKAIHYGGASSSNAPVRFYLEMQIANLKYWEKHHGKMKRGLYLTVIFFHHAIRALGCAAAHAVRPSGGGQIELKLKRNVAVLKWILSGGENRWIE